MDGWKTFLFPFGVRPIFRGKLLVSGRVHLIKFGMALGSPQRFVFAKCCSFSSPRHCSVPAVSLYGVFLGSLKIQPSPLQRSFFFKVIPFRQDEYNVNATNLQQYVDVSKNSGSPKSSILIGFSIINHPFWGTPIFGNTHVLTDSVCCSCIGSWQISTDKCNFYTGNIFWPWNAISWKQKHPNLSLCQKNQNEPETDKQTNKQTKKSTNQDF